MGTREQWWQTTPDEAEAWRREREVNAAQLARAKAVIFEVFVPAYHQGEITLENLLRGVLAAADVIPIMGALDGLPGGRDKLIGSAVKLALAKEPMKKARANAKPEAFKVWAAKLVPLVREREKLPINRATHRGDRSCLTAYQKVATVFHAAGVREVTERNVEDWYHDYRKPPKSAGV